MTPTDLQKQGTSWAKLHGELIEAQLELEVRRKAQVAAVKVELALHQKVAQARRAGWEACRKRIIREADNPGPVGTWKSRQDFAVEIRSLTYEEEKEKE